MPSQKSLAAKKAKRKAHNRAIRLAVEKARQRERDKIREESVSKMMKKNPEYLISEFNDQVLNVRSMLAVAERNFKDIKLLVPKLVKEVPDKFKDVDASQLSQYQQAFDMVSKDVKSLVTVMGTIADTKETGKKLNLVLDNASNVAVATNNLVKFLSDITDLGSNLNKVYKGEASSDVLGLKGDDSYLEFGDDEVNAQNERTDEQDKILAQEEVDVPAEQAEALLKQCHVEDTADTDKSTSEEQKQ